MAPGSDFEFRVARLAGHLGWRAREERSRRRWPLREVAKRSGLSPSFVQGIERGRPASLASYLRLAQALGLDPAFDLIDPKRRSATARHEDPVHAAMCESLARRLSAHGFQIAIDEPFQHYQFAGRADVVAWSVERRALLHVEVKTRFPNLQEAFGSYNTKRRYLPGVMAERLGVRGGWVVVTNALVALWSSEVLHELRLHPATFAAVCPDPIDAFVGWWSGALPPAGATSTLVVFDPAEVGRSDRRRYVGLEDVPTARGRYRGYADALAAVERPNAA